MSMLLVVVLVGGKNLKSKAGSSALVSSLVTSGRHLCLVFLGPIDIVKYYIWGVLSLLLG